MITTPIARRYAKALFESVGLDGINPVRQSLDAFAHAYEESSELRTVFVSPLFTTDEKQKVLLELANQTGGPPILSSLLVYALRHNRIVFIREIAQAFATLADHATGHLSVGVTSSHVLTDVQKENIKKRLEGATGKNVEVLFRADSSIIGGIVLNITGWVFDGSVKTQISRWKTTLIQE